jgi:hypothetical protein
MFSGFAGIVHKGADDTLWFDDVPVRDPRDLPRRRAWSGTLWYATPDVQPSDLGRLCQDDDVAFGPAPGKILGVRFRVGKKRRMRVIASSSWGVDRRNPNAVYRRIQRLYADALAAGLTPKTSVAGTALQAYLDRFDGKLAPLMVQLPSRFRGLAHAAMHGGPIAVLRGGAPRAVQLDVRKAYLAALYQDFPVYGRDLNGQRVGGWFGAADVPWSDVGSRTGIVDATVRVKLPDDPDGLPPLPIHLDIGAVHATGRLRGVWTTRQIRAAEERGEVEVEYVHQAMIAKQTAPIFAELADFFAKLPTDLGKRLYTRFWGRLGYRGGYVGRFSDGPVRRAVPSTSLWWSYEGIALDDPHAPRTYRPDLAAFVAAHNHQRVIETTRKLAKGSVVACHVDAIWTSDLDGALRLDTADPTPGTWRTKRSGDLRFYGAGCYVHAGSLAASGYDASVFGPLTHDSLLTWVKGSTHRRLTMQTRRWTDDPCVEQDATSRPVHLEMDLQHQPTEGPHIRSQCWTRTGWMREQPLTDEPLEQVA